jgi:pimeloyl-ACP methyl ester carboxylesterase
MISKYKSVSGGRQILDTYDQLVQAWDIPVQEEDVSTAFGLTHIILAGNPSAPPLLLFHGVGDDSAMMWRFNAKALSEHFRLVAVDTLGGPGKSEPNARYFSDFDQADWIDQIVTAKQLAPVHLAGVSNGAYLVQCYMAKHADKVVRAVCLAGGIAVKGQRGPILRMLRVFLPEAMFPTLGNMRKLIAKLTAQPDALVADPLLMAHWQALLKYFNTRSMMAHRIVGFTDEQIETIKNKALFLIGSADRLVYHPDTIALLEHKQLAFRIIDNAGHALNHEQPDRIHQALIDHLLAYPG